MPSDGSHFLLSLYSRLLPTQLLTYLGLTFILPSYGPTSHITLSLPAKYCLALVVSLLYVPVQRHISALKTARHARSLGSQLPPLLPYKWVLGIDLIMDMLREAREGYLAAGLMDQFEKMGQTFRIRVLGDTRVSRPFSTHREG